MLNNSKNQHRLIYEAGRGLESIARIHFIAMFIMTFGIITALFIDVRQAKDFYLIYGLFAAIVFITSALTIWLLYRSGVKMQKAALMGIEENPAEKD